MIRHDHVSSDGNAALMRSTGNVLLKYLVRDLQIANFSAMERADRYKEQRTIVRLKYLVKPWRSVLDHLGETVCGRHGRRYNVKL
jgi:hypothetical protein